MSGFALAIHGGAGSFRADETREQALRESLRACLEWGAQDLADGAAALDVVERAVRALEADPLFNAGTGAVLTADGEAELDASIMDGRTRRVGAVACVRRLAHPISAARLVMERTPHVLLVGEGAERFALAAGAEEIAPSALVTALRRSQLARAQQESRVSLDHDEAGTVGAVARDRDGHLAAATSTGGLTNQAPGRVGDSPVAGAGCWADDATCAVSGTGDGEAFLRCALAHEVDAGMRLKGLTLADAARAALARVTAIGGRGGLIAVDAAGAVALPFTTRAMLRGSVAANAPASIRILAD